MKRSAIRRKPKPRVNEAEALSHRLFRDAAQYQRCCQMCSGIGKDWHPHHVVYAQHLKLAGAPIYDTRNAMRLCIECHASHHNRSKVIPLAKLTDEHIAYAFEKLGLAAHHYLLQRYDGEDQRVDQALAQAEGQHGERSSAATTAL